MRIVKILGGLPTALSMDIDASQSCEIALDGYSCASGETYFSRYPIPLEKGQNRLDFRLPISPQKLCISGKMLSTGKANIASIKIKKLEVPKLESALERDFVALATYFSQHASKMPYGMKASPRKMVWLNYRPILLEEDGTKAETPARTTVDEPYIECSAAMKGYTVFQRMYILCHEFGHVASNSFDEFEADKIGARLYLGQGFPASEAYYALADVLPQNEESESRLLAMSNFLSK